MVTHAVLAQLAWHRHQHLHHAGVLPGLLAVTVGEQ